MARPRDQRETSRLVELHRVRRLTAAAAGVEAADPSERVPHRHRDREVVGAAREAQAARTREDEAGERCADQAAEEDEPDAEVRPEAELTACVVLPAEDDEENLRADDAAEEKRPRGRPERVLGQPEALAARLQPEDRGDAAARGEDSVERRHEPP